MKQLTNESEMRPIYITDIDSRVIKGIITKGARFFIAESVNDGETIVINTQCCSVSHAKKIIDETQV